MSKGSKRRPEDYNKVSQEWDRIFGDKKVVDIDKLRDKLKKSYSLYRVSITKKW